MTQQPTPDSRPLDPKGAKAKKYRAAIERRIATLAARVTDAEKSGKPPTVDDDELAALEWILDGFTNAADYRRLLLRRAAFLDARVAEAKAQGRDLSFDGLEASAIRWLIDAWRYPPTDPEP